MAATTIYIALAALLAAAVYTDVRWGRICNWITAPGVLVGIMLNVAFFGLSGLLLSLQGAALALGIFIVLSLFGRVIGAGDAKLLMAVGALVGLQMPSLLSIPFSGWAVATVLALLMGLVAFVSHKAWVSVGLGIVLAIWTVSAIFGYYVLSAHWAWPPPPPDATVTAHITSAWSTLPEDLRRTVPFAAATAVVAGIAACVMWPRLSTVLLYSLAGTLVFAVAVGAVLQMGRPQWLVILPSSTTVQLGVLGVLALLGAVIQWRLACAPAGLPADKKTDGPERQA